MTTQFGNDVGSHSMQCTNCQRQVNKRRVNKRRSGVKGSLCEASKNNKSSVCSPCLQPTDSDGSSVEIVDEFCYLGDMLSVDGDAAVSARIHCGWFNFRSLASFHAGLLQCCFVRCCKKPLSSGVQ